MFQNGRGNRTTNQRSNRTMKNIHVLPTEKPSRLYLTTHEYIFEEGYSLSTDECQNKHIYITSDEEIKDVRPHKGKWQLETGQILNKFPNYLTDLSECKLVIMTTDQDLIKDGVQAIDDEFLEWFVNNPSCEEVKVEEFEPIYGHQNNSSSILYKIIIQKEEPKQETLEEAAERLKGKELFKESNDRARKILSEIKSLPIQERSYSEEEVIAFGEFIFKHSLLTHTRGVKSLFEQFKKK